MGWTEVKIVYAETYPKKKKLKKFFDPKTREGKKKYENQIKTKEKKGTAHYKRKCFEFGVCVYLKV